MTEHERGTDTVTVESVLAGECSYDDLSSAAQALVRAVWGQRIETARQKLNFEAEFRAAGLSWVEADSDGNLIHRSQFVAAGDLNSGGFTTSRER